MTLVPAIYRYRLKSITSHIALAQVATDIIDTIATVVYKQGVTWFLDFRVQYIPYPEYDIRYTSGRRGNVWDVEYDEVAFSDLSVQPFRQRTTSANFNLATPTRFESANGRLK